MQKHLFWPKNVHKSIHEARCIVVKIGSAVLTDAHGLAEDILENIVSQLAFLQKSSVQQKSSPSQKSPLQSARKVILVSSGAVAAGRAALAEFVEKSSLNITHCLAAKQAAAAVGQSRLMQYYDTCFARHRIGTAQVLLTRDDVRSRQRFLNARNTFTKLLDWGIIPVVNENDTISVEELKFGDNDCLSSLLVNVVGADLCINLTSAPGVLSDDPQKVPSAPVIPYIERIHELDIQGLCGKKTSVGTGGMHSKLLAARRVAQLGVPTLILPGKEHDIIKKVFNMAVDTDTETGIDSFGGVTDGTADINTNTSTAPEHFGTWICADQTVISRRKFWLAYQSEPSGSIQIDAGAQNALESKGSSLLPGGIHAVEGNFQQGALVRIVLQDGKHLGVGLSNYSAAEIKRIMGLKRHEVAAILGNAHYPEVVHRDNLLLDAAI